MAIGSTPHCSGLVDVRRLAAEPDMGARRDDDPGALEALLLAPVGVGAATPAELARLQDRLRRREAALRAVLEGLPDATVGAGSDGRIVFANAHAEALFGYEHDELLGQPVQVLWPERLRERYTRNMELYFATDHPLRFTIRADGLRRDGSEFVGEMSWGIVETEAGPLLLAIGRDMTAHREALTKVQRQSRQVAAVAALGERALAGADVGDLAAEAVERLRETLPLVRAVISRDGARARLLRELGRAAAELRDPHRRGGLRRALRRRRGRAQRRPGELPARDRERARDRARAAARRGADALRGAARSADRAGQPRAVPGAADPRAGADRPRRGLGLRAVHRPRRVQGGQRSLRARRGRCAADRPVAAARAHRAPGGHGRAARRRRVRRRLRGHRRADRDPARHAPDRGDPRAAGDRRRRAPAVGVDRDRPGRRGPPRSGRAAGRRRRRRLPREGRGAGPRGGLRPAAARARARAAADGRGAWSVRCRWASCGSRSSRSSACATGASSGHEALLRWDSPGRRDVGAGRLHPGRGGVGADRRDRRVGADAGLPRDGGGVRGRRRRPDRQREPVLAPARPAGPSRAGGRLPALERAARAAGCGSSSRRPCWPARRRPRGGT